MKYLITESQYNLIQEIGRESGHYDFDPLDSFYEFLYENLTMKLKQKFFKQFFEKKLGIEIEDDDFFPSDVDDYFRNYSTSEWNDEFKTKDARSGLAYYIAKKHANLKESFGLYYMTNKIGGGDIIYYFFDPKFKIFVGRMYITKPDGHLPKKTYQVGLSTADEDLIGGGYGTKMYLTVINNVEYLKSDSTLYSGSYRMWKHVLPKYVNVWGVSNKDIFKSFTKLSPEKKMSVRKFDYFIASSKHNTI